MRTSGIRMQAIRAAFERLRRQHRRALVPFIMGGDPSLALTRQLLLALEDAGADCIEVGIPFSDPLADGPTIQASSVRALARGTTPARVLDAVASVRHRLRVPVICLTYWNPVAQFGRDGAAPFLRAARGSGVHGLIVPDLPTEEAVPLRAAAAREDLATIFLVAPTSGPERMRAIARASEGFIYYVSVTGTTGVRRQLPPSLVQGVRQLRLVTTKPICVGFGISTPAHAAAVARIADGVIVGSALIRAIAAPRTTAGRLRAATALMTRLRRAV